MTNAGPAQLSGDYQGAGDRRDDVRGLAGNVVQALFRLVKLSTLHSIDNQAMTRAVAEAVQAVHEFGDRSGQNVSILFSGGSILAGGQLLKANRSVYEGAAELGMVLRRMGVGEIGVAKDVRAPDMYAFASAVAEAIRSSKPQIAERPSPGIRLRPVKETAWVREMNLEQHGPTTAVVRTYASAVVIMRRFLDDMRVGRYVLPQRVKRVAQRLVDLSEGETPAFLGVTAARNANHDDAGRAVNSAILALAMARQVSGDVVMLVRLAMAALLHDAGRPRASGAMPSRSQMIPQLSEQQDLEMPAATAVVLTALGGWNEPAMMRVVTSYEAHWLKRQDRLGPIYGGLRQPVFYARILAVARAFNDHLTPLPGQSAPSADEVIAELQTEAQDPADRTVLRLLIGALGIFPTGTIVELSTGEIAVVVQTHSHPSRYSRPRIRVVLDGAGGTIQHAAEIDLSEPAAAGGPARHIVKIVATADDATVASVRAIAALPVESSGGALARVSIAPPGPVSASEPPETRVEPASTRLDVLPSREDPVTRAERGEPSPPAMEAGFVPVEPPSRRLDPRVEPQPPSRRLDPRVEPQPPSRRMDPRVEPQPPSRRMDPRVDPQPPSRRLDPRVDSPPPSRRLDARVDSQPPSRPMDARVDPQPPSRRMDPRVDPQPPSRRVDPRMEPAESVSAGAEPALLGAFPLEPGFDAAVTESPEPPSTLRGAVPAHEGLVHGFGLYLGPQADPESTPVPSTHRAASSETHGRARHRKVEGSPYGTRDRGDRGHRHALEHDEDALGLPVMEDPKPAEQTPAGAADTTPTAEGTLSRTPLAHLLVYMLDQRLSGTAVFNAPHGVSHTVYFLEGVPAKIRTGGMIAPLDRVLLELGMLDEATLRTTLLEISKLKILHGRHLVSKGLLTQSALLSTLKVQLIRKLTHLFELPLTTRYAYYDKLNLLASYGGPDLTPCEPLAAILAGMRVRSDDPLIDATLARFSGRPIGLHPDAEPKRFEMQPDERAVTDMLRVGHMTLEELLAAGVAQERVVQLMVYVLAITRHLDYGAPGARPPVGIAVRDRSQPAARTTPQQRDADPQPVSRAATAAAAPLVPSDGPTPSPSPAQAEPIELASTVARADSPPAGTITPREMSDELLARRAEIERRVASIDSEDYFQMLGTGRDAQPEELKAAYFALVKVWHPDRLPRDLATMKPLVARVFARLTEAYQTLSDSAQRAEYERILGEGGGTPEDQERIARTVDAAMEFQKAEILLKKQDFAGAEDLVRRAAQSDPEQPDYVALLVWIQALRRGDPPPAAEGKPISQYDDLIEQLDALLLKEPRYERALFYRGMLLKRSGHVDAAVRDFRLAAEINPKNIDAVREVRLYEMRTRTAAAQSPPPGGVSLFGKLFKR